jgi:hypothetical protein
LRLRSGFAPNNRCTQVLAVHLHNLFEQICVCALLGNLRECTLVLALVIVVFSVSKAW